MAGHRPVFPYPWSGRSDRPLCFMKPYLERTKCDFVFSKSDIVLINSTS